MDNAMVLMTLALISERLVEASKGVLLPFLSKWPEDRKTVLWKTLGLFFGILFAAGAKVDIFSILGVTSTNPVLGIAISGIFAGMGTEWVHQLLTNLPQVTVEGRRQKIQRLSRTQGQGK